MSTPLTWAPTVPGHWQVVPLNALAKMGTGHTPDRAKQEYWEDCTIPWVTTPDATREPLSLSPLLDTDQKISELGMQNSAAVLHPSGTVMLSRTASVGYSLSIGKPMATTQAFVTWLPGPRLDTRYLLLVLRAMSSEWSRLAYGSTHLTIYMPDLESLKIPLPPLDEQIRIADFLYGECAQIDRVLKIRRQQKALIEERQSVQLERCVTADEGDGDRILGRVSRSWKRTTLGRLIDRIDVGVVINPSSYFEESGVPFLHGFNVRSGWIDLRGVRYISEASNNELKRSQVRAGDVLVVRAGAPGRASVVPPDLDRTNCASVLILRATPSVIPEYLAAFFNGPPGKGQIGFSQYGAAQEVISAAQVSGFKIALPSPAEQVCRIKRYDESKLEAEKIAGSLDRQITLLLERRASLIYSGVTGQLDVTTARGAEVVA